MLRYNLRYQVFLAFSDALIIIAALAGASFLRMRIDLGMEVATEALYTPPLLFLIAPVLWLFAFQQSGVYRAVNNPSLWKTLQQIIGGHALASLLFLGALYVTFRDYSRLQAVYFLVLAALGLLTHRIVLRRLRAWLHPYINNRRNVLIVGATSAAQHIGELVKTCAESGLHLVGYVNAQPEESAESLQSWVIGTLDDLPELVRVHRVDEVVIATRWLDEPTSQRISHIMRLLESFPVNVRIAPDYSDLAYFRASYEEFGDVTLVSLRESVLSPVEKLAKRLFDIGFSALFLAVTWPLFITIMIAIRLDSPGPVIYRQLRIGQHGRRFTIFKFRTMYINADQIIDPRTIGVKRRDDPRVTRVGRFLRRTSLDELPQFINVLKGEMSVVGPRPEVTWLVDQYEWWQRKRFEVPQGVTGWWQVNGRADKPLSHNTEDDLYYVRNYSFWFDLRIVVLTAVAVMTGKGAY